MGIHSPLMQCLIFMGGGLLIGLLMGSLLAKFLVWRYKIKPEPAPLATALKAFLLCGIFLFGPIAALTFWYAYLSRSAKIILVAWIVLAIVGSKIYQWRKYHVLWGLGKDCYGKENSEKNKDKG